ncbi:MAG: 4-hydroxythreonine-4-phosphate dehydrogenase PdxA [Opitutales bacterium]|nr:4-hydroxythreonine-4-phosphate dehydrogenase PdxA [Opitutales bacterium]NRA26251.1 4-hydroxythreonine-4-phosphate dehydrogenase PdxA [Opitutales bacterium]
MRDLKPIAVTCGDPAGVGPEVIAHWLADNPQHHNDICIIGPSHWTRQHRVSNSVQAVSVGDKEYIIHPGEPDTAGAAIARDALYEAATGIIAGKYRAVVTGPIAKSWMQQVGFDYPGHTEFFADQWGGEPTMAFTGKYMRIALVTWHCPLNRVGKEITFAGLERAVRNLHFLLTSEGKPEPRIAVCGVNPHAGEGGMLGNDEVSRLNPWLNDLRPEFPGLSECLPGDTVFWRHLKGDFDGVIAMYHDQGLGPLKTVEFDSAVNITLGLPHVRTSPDHGTGFSIAGKNLATTTSFDAAFKMALRLSA